MNKYDQRYEAWEAAARVVDEAVLATAEEHAALMETHAAFSEAYSASAVNMKIQLPTRHGLRVHARPSLGVLYRVEKHTIRARPYNAGFTLTIRGLLLNEWTKDYEFSL